MLLTCLLDVVEKILPQLKVVSVEKREHGHKGRAKVFHGD